jgi:hypothetical protein
MITNIFFIYINIIILIIIINPYIQEILIRYQHQR